MKEFKNYIFERLVKTKLRGKNVLYHSSGIIGSENILKTDYLKGETWNYRIPNNSKFLKKLADLEINDDEYKNLKSKKLEFKLEGISLTRDWYLNYNGAVTFILDKDKIKQKYGKKLQPIDYFGNNNNYKELNGFTQDDIEFTKHLSKSDPERPRGSVESEEFLNINKLVNLHKYILGFIFTFHDYNLSQPEMIKNVEDYCNKYKLHNIPIYDFGGNEISIIK